MICNLYIGQDSNKKRKMKNYIKKITTVPPVHFIEKKLKLDRHSRAYKKMNDFLLSDKIPLFDVIQIETVNRCNGICSFCPVNKKNDDREYKRMDEDLLVSIINQLKDLGYNRSLALFCNNEPFLDDRICELSKIARNALPDARIHMLTNGTLLTVDKFLQIMPYLDQLVIDNYNNDLKMNQSTKLIYDYCTKDNRYANKVEIHMRKADEVLSSRAGFSPNKKCREIITAPCVMPFDQMIVRPDGKVSLCCNDALGKVTLGDLSQSGIVDVWTSEEYRQVRLAMKNGRENGPLCAHCDAFTENY